MNLKKSLLAGAAGAALFAFAAPVATPAEAGAIKGGSATDLTVYGQVSRSILFYDDGEESGYRHTDADNSSTRFGFKAAGKVNEAVTMGARLEVEIQSNDSNNVSQNAETESTSSVAERLMNVYIDHKQFGRVTIGQASNVSDGMSDGLDLSGAAFAFSGMDVQLGNGGGLLFRNDNTAGALSSNAIGDTFTTFDRGRQDMLGYETPSFGGMKLEAGLYERGDWGIGAKYDQKHGTVNVRVRAFYENLAGAGTTKNAWQVGASVKHDSGVSVTGLYGSSDQDSGNDHKVYSARIGYTANMNALGATGIAVNYFGTEDMNGDGEEGTAWGIGVVQDIKSAGANLFGAVNFWDRDRATSETVDTDEIVTVVVGARVKF